MIAKTTWAITYKHIISAAQMDYMLNLFYSKDALEKQMYHLQHQFIVTKEENDITGFASYSKKQDSVSEIYRLHKIYLLPNQQGKGTGKLLLDYIVADIKPQGAVQLELNVNRHNNAFYFYSKYGFRVDKEENIDIGEGYFMNDYVMVRDI